MKIRPGGVKAKQKGGVKKHEFVPSHPLLFPVASEILCPLENPSQRS
jgi:hypothetical protein